MRLTVWALGGLLLLAAGATEAWSQRVTDTVVGSCVYSFGAAHCVRQYRYGDAGNNGIQALKEPSEETAAEARERDRLWLARCRPIVRQDALGVGRYHYAAPGCEFGRFAD